MKKYTVTYTITETFECEETAKQKLEHYKKFPNIYQDLKSSLVDEFMEFLDNNPPNEVQETTEPTEEQKIAWQADLDAHEQNQAFLFNYYSK